MTRNHHTPNPFAALDWENPVSRAHEARRMRFDDPVVTRRDSGAPLDARAIGVQAMLWLMVAGVLALFLGALGGR